MSSRMVFLTFRASLGAIKTHFPSTEILLLLAAIVTLSVRV